MLKSALRTLAALPLVLLLFVPAQPSAYAQSNALYFPATGHILTDDQGLLSFWRDHNGDQLLGFPISEAFTDEAGQTTQYFERGRLEQQFDSETNESSIHTGAVGSEYAQALWKRFAAALPRKPIADEQVFESTGHTLREPFLSFWRAAGGIDFFGAPISEPMWELTARGQQQVQYFERARLERIPTITQAPDTVRVSDLGRSLALLNTIDTAPVDNWGAETYGPPAVVTPEFAPFSPSAPTAQPTAQPTALPAATRAPVAATAQPTAKPQPVQAQPRASSGTKLIVVNLSDQWMYAYEGDTQVFDAPVSTGRDGMNTPTGTYAIYAKLKLQTMSGVLDGEKWVVPNVPNVMYFNGGVALHGTYWHNRFGTGARLSHGCVNLPLDAAEWLYSWAPMGTTVRVTY